jgi:phage terminase large subunit
VSIRAGHGVGKTALEAWTVLWFMLTRTDFKIPITANSQDQLRDVVWPELRLWHRKLPEELREQVEITAERLFLKAAPEWFAVARTAAEHNTEALQGFHAKNLLFVLEEASGIADAIVEVAMGALSTKGAKQLMCGNPTKLSGYFYDSHHSLRERWKTLRVSSEDVPAAQGHIADIVAKYGKESNAYRIRVLGEFPTQEDETVIPLDIVEQATTRDIQENEEFRVVWGVDVARFGDDRTALAKRRGNTMPEPVKWWRQKDTMQVAGLVMEEYRFLEQTARDLLPAEILVDVIGLGAGVVDRLNELGLPVRGVNVAEQPAASERFMRLRDELWFRARDWFRERQCKMVKDEALISELTAPTYTFTSSGKIVVEPKDEMKKRGLRSPDLADAFILTFAGGLDRREAHESDRYKRRRVHSGSWMTA